MGESHEEIVLDQIFDHRSRSRIYRAHASMVQSSLAVGGKFIRVPWLKRLMNDIFTTAGGLGDKSQVTLDIEGRRIVKTLDNLKVELVKTIKNSQVKDA